MYYIIFVSFQHKLLSYRLLHPHWLIFIHIHLAMVFQINHDTKNSSTISFLVLQSSFSFDRNILGIYRINQRLETFHHHSFMANLDKRKIVIKVIGKSKVAPLPTPV